MRGGCGSGEGKVEVGGKWFGYFFLSPVISSRSGVGTGIFQCRGVLLIIMKGQGPIMLMVGSGGVVRLFFFSLGYHFFSYSVSL